MVYRYPFPTLGETVLCARCGKSATVGEDSLLEWHFSCLDCRAGRWTGVSKLNADFFAANHYHKKGHRTQVKREVNPELKERLADAAL